MEIKTVLSAMSVVGFKEKRLCFDAEQAFDTEKRVEAMDGSFYDPVDRVLQKTDGSKYDFKTNVFTDESGNVISMDLAQAAEKFPNFLDAEKLQAIEKKAKGRNEAGVEATMGRAEAARGVIEADLEKFKDKIVAVKEGLGLSSSEYSEVVIDDPNNFTDIKSRDLLAGKISEQFSGKKTEEVARQLSKLLDGKTVEEGAAIDFASKIYAFAILNSVKSEFSKRYLLYDQFIADESGKGLAKNLSFSAKVNQFGVIDSNSVSFVFAATDFQQKYNAFKDKAPAKAETPKASEAASETANEVARKATAIKTSFAGGLLIALGIVKPDDPNSKTPSYEKAFAQVVDGSNGIAAMIVGFLGGGALLSDGGAAYNDMFQGLDKKYQLMIEQAQKSTGPLSLKKAAVKLGGAEKPPKEFVKGGFKDLIATKTVPDEGAKLSEEVELGNDGFAPTLKIDLKDGGEVIVPKGAKIVVDTKERGGSSDAEFALEKGKVSIITGKIPKGTIFKKGVKFDTA